MNIRHAEIEIDAADPFKNCKLDRKKYADALTSIVNMFSEGCVVSINNEWGTGKTTFVKMWERHLSNNGFKVLYFNAWENDFEPDALNAILGELKPFIGNEKEFKSMLSKGATLTKNIVPSLIRAAAEKYIGVESLAELFENSTKAATEILSEEVDSFKQKQRGLVDFREKLQQAVKKLAFDKPLIFIVDELDRCRPSYAVEFLEKVKHFFNVKGITFVLSIDKSQLCHAIQGFYGSNEINAEEYLRRFIDIEYRLPKPDRKAYTTYLATYYQFPAFFYSERRKHIGEFSKDYEQFVDFSIDLLEGAGATLRHQEKLFAHARIGLSSFQFNEYVFPSVYFLLMYLRTFGKKLFNQLRDKSVETFMLPQKLRSYFPHIISQDRVRFYTYVEALMVHLYNNSLPPTRRMELVSNNEIVSDPNFKSSVDHASNQQFAAFIVGFDRSMEIYRADIDHLLNKIDLFQNVVSSES